jgi:hypothetical protein
MGIFAIAYTDFSVGGFGYSNPPPYRNLGMVLIFGGIFLFVFGLVSTQRYSVEETIGTNLR